MTLAVDAEHSTAQPAGESPQASANRLDTLLFGEGSARILVSIAPDQVAAWEAYLTDQLDGTWQQLGRVGSEITPLSIVNVSGVPLISASIADMGDRWSTAIERRLAL